MDRTRRALQAAEAMLLNPDLVPEGAWEWWGREWQAIEAPHHTSSSHAPSAAAPMQHAACRPIAEQSTSS